MNDRSKYTLIWQACGKNSDLARRFHVPGFAGYLPFFLEGDDVTDLENKHRVELGEPDLLKGILYGLGEYALRDEPWHSDQDKETFLYLLGILGLEYDFPNPEVMILDVASGIREDHGSAVSCQALEGGLQAIPGSSKIMSDMICDLWEMAATDEWEAGDGEGLSESQQALLERVLVLIDQVNMLEIESEPCEVICFLGFSSLLLLGRPEKGKKYLEKYIFPNMKNRELMDKIMFLSLNPEKACLERIESIF